MFFQLLLLPLKLKEHFRVLSCWLHVDNRSNLGWERIEQCVLLMEWSNISRVDIVEKTLSLIIIQIFQKWN
ncbi:hypothetical protein DICPUDRAFT_72846, partial [Dictyostelium purpureum]